MAIKVKETKDNIKAKILKENYPIKSACIKETDTSIKANIQSNLTNATTTNKGIVRLATLEEAILGIDNTIAITPYTLHNVGTYTEGNGINITNKIISVDDNIIATKEFVNEEINLLDNQISLINNTINSYGDIVSYNAADFATSGQGDLANSALQPNDNISELVNNVGYITGITSSNIQTALGYIPYSSENPSGFITVSALSGYATENWVGQQGYLISSDLSGYATEQWVNNQGFIKGINGIDVINALGYTPYDNSNPAGYITSASLPTVNNSTITIQKNGLDIESFNLNQSTNETINITVPTQTSDLTNNSGFITNTVNNLTNYYLKSETYTKTEVQNLISGITGITIEVVNVLPASGENGVIYLVPKVGASPDIYNEYIWVETDEDFELIGNTEIDLTNYVQFTDLATVATSGSYDDLSNKPTIPTVGNGTITINQGGTQKGTFTTNQSGNTTIDLDGTITVDSTLSTTSTNPVQNKVITTSLNKKLENTSTGYNSLTVGGNSYSSGNTLNVGKGSKALANWSTALGFSAETRAESAIQLGYGKNYDELTLAVGFVESDTEYEVQNAYNYTLLDGATGLIPDARLSNNIARTTDIGNGTITFTQGGVTKGTITTNQSGNTTIAFDAGGGGGGAVDSVNGQTGVVVLTASDVGALPDSTTIPSKTSDLTNDSGFITGITSSDVITALTYTPYNGATNPNGYITNSALTGYATETWVGQQGYITGITSSDVTTALGYTPYNSSNPNGYITSADLPTNYVTTDTAQDISGRKTFLGEKAIYFKQQATTNKLGFTLYNPSNTELGALEYRPNTISGSSLLTLNCPQTTGGYVGFRYWGSPAVNIVAPKVATAGNYFIPTHITDGNTTVTASNTGTVNISTLLPDISTKQDTLVSGTNIKTVNNTSLLGSGNIDTSEVFIAEYGTTQIADITSALSSGKLVYCKYTETSGSEISDVFFQLTQAYTDTLGQLTQYEFSYTFEDTIYNTYIDTDVVDNGWKSIYSYTIQPKNLVTSISSSSTNTQYPSAKCVYDNLQTKANTSDIPTTISDLTDDTATTPIDKAESVEDQRDSSSLKYWTGTKAQYDAIVTKDSDTIYNVEDTTSPIVDILNTLYPIGAIYIGTMATCPLSVLGIGTWQLVAQDRVLQGAGTRGAVGTTINESLPNITGEVSVRRQNSAGTLAYSSGAFYNGGLSGTSDSIFYSTDTTSQYNKVGFNASNSSDTYQDNAPVQQDAYLVNIWERIS